MLSKYLLIALGAVLGAWSRFALGDWLKAYDFMSFPIGTFVVNFVGSFGIGWFFPHFQHPPSEAVRYFVLTGFFGAFTTFSTFSLESLHLLQKGKSDIALLYIGLSLLCCLLGVYVGSWLNHP